MRFGIVCVPASMCVPLLCVRVVEDSHASNSTLYPIRFFKFRWQLYQDRPSESQLYFGRHPSRMEPTLLHHIPPTPPAPCMGPEAMLTELRAVGRWRPDFLAVSYSRSKIAIVEVCRHSDVHLERLDAAYQGKLAVYGPLLTALSFYSQSGWTVQILPRVVGARGLIKKSNMCNALEFLEVPHRKQQSIIECTVQASIDALAFMHTTRFSARFAGPSQLSSSSKADPPVFDLPGRGKRKAQKGPGDLGAIMMRWKRMAAASRRH